jgi:hypothetical protein
MIVEFDIDSGALRQSLAAAPGMRVRIEHLDATDTIPLRSMFWASDGDFEAFETALDDDPTVEQWTRLAETDEGRLYRARHPADASSVATYHGAVELDGIVLSLASKEDRTGYHARMRFPDREKFAAFRDAVGETGLSVGIKAIYDQQDAPPEERFGLTQAQRETLLTAVAAGYFSIPRETALAGVADQLGISPQAASERLRRGMESLIRGALDVPDDDDRY